MIFLFIGICLIAAFIFSGIESGVLAVNRIALRNYALRGEIAAQQLETLLTYPGRLLVTVTLINIATRILAFSFLFDIFEKHLGNFGSAALLTACLPIFALAFEFLPKALFQRFPYRTLVLFARILVGVNWLLLPVSILAEAIARPILRASQNKVGKRIASIEEIRHATNQGALDGTLNPLQKHLIHSVLNARRVRAGQLLIPLDKTIHVKPNDTIEIAFAKAKEKAVNSLPVIDLKSNVEGVLLVFDLLTDRVCEGNVQTYTRRIVEVKEDLEIIEVLVAMRAAHSSMAAIRNRRTNSLRGIIFSEDIVRRLLLG